MYKLFTITLVFIAGHAFPQFTATGSSAESTCPNNGLITINAENPTLQDQNDNCSGVVEITVESGPTEGGPYPYAVQVASCSNGEYSLTIPGLYPGDYEVEVNDFFADPENSINLDINVPGDYQEPLLSLDGDQPGCPGTSTGSITATMTQGLPAYTYSIKESSQPDTDYSTPQSSNIFENLAAGSYDVRAYDQCGNFQTRTYSLSDEPYDPPILTKAGISPDRVACDMAEYSLGTINGKSDFVYELLNPPTGYTGPTSINSSSQATFTLPIDSTNPGSEVYNFRVTDACGNTDDYTHTTTSVAMQYQEQGTTCDDWSFIVSPRFMYGNLTYTITNHPADYTPEDPVDPSFENVPFGSYSGTVTDECGRTLPWSRTRSMVEPDFRDNHSTRANSCNEGMGDITVFLESTSSSVDYGEPLTFTLLNPPTGYTDDVVELQIGASPNATFRELPAGTYNFRVDDDCGNSDLATVVLENVLETEISAEVEQGCFNDNTITTTFTRSNNASVRYDLLDASGSVIRSNDLDGIFENVPPGDYTVRARLYGNSTFPECWRFVDVVVTETPLPTINPIRAYACSPGGTITTTAAGISGVDPFTYDLLEVNQDGSFTEIETGADSPVFEDLDASKTYKIRIVDDCGNTANGDVVVIDSGFGFTMQGDDCSFVGEAFPFYFRDYHNITFTWTSPTGSEYTGNDPREEIGILEDTDFGEWSVAVDFNSGCRIGTFNYTLEDCGFLPIELIEFEVYPVDYSAKLSWSTSAEINSKEYDVEVSTDGINFEQVAIVPSKSDNGFSEQVLTYDYLHEYSAKLGRVLYYRVKQIDYDGQFSYTPVRMIYFEKTFTNNVVFPSPVISGENVTVQAEKIQTLHVFDANGNLVHVIKETNTQSSTSFSTSGFSAGMYLIVLNNKDYIKFLVH